MDQLSAFLTENIYLAMAFVIILVLLLNNLFAAKLKGYHPVSPSEATQLINHSDAVIVDVREDKEFVTGHIVNSIHIPQSTITNRLSELDDYKQKPVIVSCRSGSRSAHVCGILKKNGFDQIHNLSGGIMAWQNASLPITKQ
ncbi:MAG: rhodanese-like domain-containing protein [Gammaproteobacteria bacterium]